MLSEFIMRLIKEKIISGTTEIIPSNKPLFLKGLTEKYAIMKEDITTIPIERYFVREISRSSLYNINEKTALKEKTETAEKTAILIK